MSYEHNINQLRERGYTELPALSVETRKELFGAFARLVENNHDELRATHLDETGRGYGRGGFQEVPAESREGKDFSVSKEVFLYDPAFRESWGSSLSPEVEDFLELCHGAYDVALTSVAGVARALGKLPQYQGFARRVITPDGQCNGRLTVQRFNVPHQHDPNNQLFGSHRDQSMLSMHLGDTHPGFYFTDTSRERTPYDLQDNTGALFVGRQWDRAYPDSDIKARFHGVDLPKEIEDVQRMSTVLFVDEIGFSRSTNS